MNFTHMKSLALQQVIEDVRNLCVDLETTPILKHLKFLHLHLVHGIICFALNIIF